TYGNSTALDGPIPPIELFTLEGESAIHFMPPAPVLSAIYDEKKNLLAVSGLDYISVSEPGATETRAYIHTSAKVYSIEMNPSGTYAAAISDSGNVYFVPIDN